MRELRDPAMQCFEAARQNRMIVRRGEHLVDQSDREDADGDGGAPGDAGRKHLQRAVDLLDGNQGDGDAAESRRISAIAVQHPGDVDAKSDPDPQHCGQERAGLGKGAGDGDRCDHADGGCEQPIARLFHALRARGQRQDCHGDGCRRGGFEFEPEAHIECEEHCQQDAQRECPGTHRKAGEDPRADVVGSAGGVPWQLCSLHARQSVRPAGVAKSKGSMSCAGRYFRSINLLSGTHAGKAQFARAGGPTIAARGPPGPLRGGG